MISFFQKMMTDNELLKIKLYCDQIILYCQQKVFILFSASLFNLGQARISEARWEKIHRARLPCLFFISMVGVKVKLLFKVSIVQFISHRAKYFHLEKLLKKKTEK